MDRETGNGARLLTLPYSARITLNVAPWYPQDPRAVLHLGLPSALAEFPLSSVSASVFLSSLSLALRALFPWCSL